ncbi:hypothetical protein KVT40_007345 [Elsinoe batatas]|uniref:Uncharacterized protein n=1 Tax=Elsinoe batatas TaxID=2601811 RepID=A0A8K0L1U3_9PEZI|nr:hypothetical protein KVT40_007345 [Elsinoe batatas]
MQQSPPLQTLHLRNPDPRGPRLTISSLLNQHPLLATNPSRQEQEPAFPAATDQAQPKLKPAFFRNTMQRNHVIILVLLVFILALLVFWALWCRALDREIVHKTRRRVKRREDVESEGSRVA